MKNHQKKAAQMEKRVIKKKSVRTGLQYRTRACQEQEELGAAATKVVRRNGGRNDKEEKMDMLWEDFNTEETLTRNHGSSRLDSETVHTGCVRALQLSKPNGTSIISPKETRHGGVHESVEEAFLDSQFS
ncbi:hypothetical protein OIU74_024704 [Salix koriyanagi]|uniref:Uncharacterized protein n=1 Tax=Salix koriyanagi TaxID=2511006 RepID=A0A9Q0W7P3_9ROSI|nr:hypothetical protein OIU74_024704 [Salix koriyanagi]